MDVNCEKQFFASNLAVGLHMKWRFGMIATASSTFKGGWSQFAEDHDIHQGFFMAFDFHIGTSKFDVKIYDGTQC
jgi:hypothetical protein